MKTKFFSHRQDHDAANLRSNNQQTCDHYFEKGRCGSLDTERRGACVRENSKYTQIGSLGRVRPQNFRNDP
jgi:hypothetical protein